MGKAADIKRAIKEGPFRHGVEKEANKARSHHQGPIVKINFEVDGQYHQDRAQRREDLPKRLRRKFIGMSGNILPIILVDKIKTKEEGKK